MYMLFEEVNNILRELNFSDGGFMRTEKHIKITGYSDISWKDAIVKTISEVSKTINHLTSVNILEQCANISEDKITEYKVTLDLTFWVDNEKREK